MSIVAINIEKVKIYSVGWRKSICGTTNGKMLENRNRLWNAITDNAKMKMDRTRRNLKKKNLYRAKASNPEPLSSRDANVQCFVIHGRNHERTFWAEK